MLKKYYEIARKEVNGKMYLLVESEIYGEEDTKIIDEYDNIILDEVYNGFLDLEEYLESEAYEQNVCKRT